MCDDLVERVARAIAKSQGDDFDQMPLGKSEWTASRGYFGGRFRDINEPMKSDYLDMAHAAIDAMREPTDAMLGGYYGVEPRRLFTEMIDAALEKDKANVG